MTAQTRKKIGELVLSALLGLLATMFLVFGTGAWASKENANDHDRDIDAVIELQVRTLDAVCDGQARQSRACTAPRPVVGKKTP